MKKLYLTLILACTLFILNAQERSMVKQANKPVKPEVNYLRATTSLDYENDFQDTLLMQDMVMENVDGNTDSDYILNFLMLNFTVQTWQVLHFSGETNYWAGSNSQFNPPGTADRWLITPSIVVSDGAQLEWKAKSIQVDTNQTIETYEVYISTSGGSNSTYFAGTPLYSEPSTPLDWDTQTIDLQSFYGDTIWVAFRHTSTDQGFLGIDDIKVGTEITPANGMSGDFENVADFSTDLDPWITIDVDQSATYGFSNIYFPHTGEALSFISFNPSTTVPALTNLQPHSGERVGACFAAIMPGQGGTGPNNDWLISPKAEIAPNGKVSFWAKSITSVYGLERFKVGVSTTTPEPESFTIISDLPYTQVDTSWTQFEYELTNYVGQQVYIGINCVSEDAFVFCIDDIEIDTVGTIGISENSFSNLKIFPNPVSNQLSIQNAQNYTIEIFNINGKLLAKYDSDKSTYRIDVNNLHNGLYFVRLSNKNEVVIRKFQKI